jgi:glycine cleavage system H lipoate-binding protein
LDAGSGAGEAGCLRLGLAADFVELLAPEEASPRPLALELAPVGARLAAGDALGCLHVATGTVDLRAPFGLVVVARNEAALADPRLVVASPHRRGWLIEARRA